MGGEEQLEYGRAARLRVAMAALLAGISDCARDGVPAFPDRDAVPGALAQLAARVAADARQLVTLAVACERSRGASWEAIAGALGLGGGGQAARDLYLPALAELDQAALEGWILGDDPQFTGIPGRVGEQPQPRGTSTPGSPDGRPPPTARTTSSRSAGT